MRLHPIPPDQQHTQPWRNGAGLTRELYCSGDAERFVWRASIAAIERSSAFSRFPGCTRWMALLDGGPLRLLRGDAGVLAVEPRLKAHRFSGEESVRAELFGDAASVFNLMARDGLVDAQLLLRPLVGAMVIFDEPGVEWLLHMLSGEAELRAGEERHWIGSGHSVLLACQGQGLRAVLDGGGVVALAKLRHCDPSGPTG